MIVLHDRLPNCYVFEFEDAPIYITPGIDDPKAKLFTDTSSDSDSDYEDILVPIRDRRHRHFDFAIAWEVVQ